MKLTSILPAFVLSTKILSPPVLISHSTLKLFHEGPIYDPDLRTVLISSDILDNTDFKRPTSASTVLDMVTGNLVSYNSTTTKVPYANGGVRTSAGYIICAQGDIDRESGLYLLNPHTMVSKPLVTSYNGDSFNSLNDIVMRGNVVYFTDPDYGFTGGFRKRPRNPSAVYRGVFDAETETLTKVERILESFMFDKPNGIAISPDGKTILVTDSGYFVGDGRKDPKRPQDIYAWDVGYLHIHVWDPQFVYKPARKVYKTEVGIPDGIKFDSKGRLWVANYAGEGILQVDYKTGKLVAKIVVEGGSANFAFVPGKEGREEMIIMGDNNLWMHDLKDLE